MEQVFGMVNQLLIKNSETRKRKLKMRTYKVWAETIVVLLFVLNCKTVPGRFLEIFCRVYISPCFDRRSIHPTRRDWICSKCRWNSWTVHFFPGTICFPWFLCTVVLDKLSHRYLIASLFLSKSTFNFHLRPQLFLRQVIPLSQRSGIVEWCEDTVPLGEYLIGRPGTKTGAHPRYYPGDWTSLDCRKKIQVQPQCSKDIPTNIVTPSNKIEGEHVMGQTH